MVLDIKTAIREVKVFDADEEIGIISGK